MNRNQKLLEFNIILEKTAELAFCEQAKQSVFRCKRFDNPQEMKLQLEKIDALAMMCQAQGAPSLYSVNAEFPSVIKRSQLSGTLSMGELLSVLSLLKNAHRLLKFRDSVENFNEILDEDYFFVYYNKEFAERLSESIISESEMSDRASSELARIRREIINTEMSIKDKLEKTVKSQQSSRFLQDNVVTMRNGRYVVPIKAEHKGDFSGVIHDVSASGSTIFVEPTAVVEANAKILRLKNEEQHEIERILIDLSGIVDALSQQLLNCYESVVELDIMLAKAKLGVAQRAVKPNVSGDSSFSLVSARHPLIPRDEVVPIDLTLGKEFDSLIITGPNTGGKTVTLKTVGLLLTMASHGFLIPASERSVVSCFDEIFVDIGDEQSIEQSLSTFYSHVKNIKGILDKVGPNCLVLLDELGSGTDPAEGAALATAIIEQLMNLGAFTIATTHYAELKIFALETDGVQNASCEFDVATLRPTYKIILGVPGRSNAFLIGKRLGLSQELIDSASRHLSAENKRFEKVLAELDSLKLEMHNQNEYIETLKSETMTALEQAKTAQSRAETQASELIEQAKFKAKKTLSDTENEAHKLLDEMRALQRAERMNANEKAAAAKELLKRSESGISKLGSEKAERDFKPLKDCNVGDSVYSLDLNRNVSVFSVDKNKKTAVVVSGNIRSTIAFSRLSMAKKSDQNDKKNLRRERKIGITSNADRKSSSELMLIGKNVDEACMMTDIFIDNAVLSGLNMVYLVHGKGTGALRKGLHQHLRTHRSVKSFRLGIYGEGEDGVTIVELK